MSGQYDVSNAEALRLNEQQRELAAKLANGDQPRLGGRIIKYGNWEISYNPPPIPSRNCDWQYCHKDFDGADDACDGRYGSAASLIDAMCDIDDREDEHFEQHGCDKCSQAFITSCLSLGCKYRDDMNARRDAYTIAFRADEAARKKGTSK